ncbi:MAG: shikimate dehydrogenase [Chloracidobacterium sp.]|nr:shikimate dehydrogenase [Chloracidobacterium sp.]MDW8218846.1 shikimate dehydrogenase [Acidobacteriota bacterium]
MPIAAATADALFAALASAVVADADWLELRLDALQMTPPAEVSNILRQALTKRTKPVVVTFRPREQGGFRELTRDERLAFWRDALQTEAEAFDVELDLVAPLLAAYSPDQPVWSRIIISQHDFHETPPDVGGFAATCFPPYAGAAKLATTVNRPDDVARLFHWLQTPQPPTRKIAVGMGGYGVFTRILGPAYGARWTYAAAHDGRAIAPGQLPAAELRRTFRVPELNRETIVTGLIGAPIAHSLSKDLHNAAFTHLGLNWVYIPVEVSPDDLGMFVRDFVHPRTRRTPWSVGGYSVTLPHKTAVIPYLDHLTPTAARVGAVNTLLTQGTELIGDNTDVVGAMRPLTERFTVSGRPVAVIGAGGAAHAVVCGLVEAGAQVTVFARCPARAQALGARFGVPVEPLERFCGAGFTGLINTTPVGMAGYAETACPVAPEKLDGLAWAYDLVYRPRRTPLLQAAADRGIAVLDGLPMLVAQAAEQFTRWTGQTAPVSVMQAAAERALAISPTGT